MAGEYSAPLSTTLSRTGHDTAEVENDELCWEARAQEAKDANFAEHNMTVAEAMRSYPWAVVWSVTISMSIIMEGYGTSLIGSFYGYPAFRRQFGQSYPDHHDNQVPQAWQSALGVGSSAGCIVGAFLNGYLIKPLGFKKVFMGALVSMCAFIFVSFFGRTLGAQVAGQVLCGIPWGIFATIGPAYSSELVPLALRPYLTAYTNMCFAIGQLISAGVLQSLIGRPGQWSYRIPLAVQWVWPLPLFCISFFMPESPWWQVRQGKYDAAQETMQGLMSTKQHLVAQRAVAMMIHTDRIESELETGTSYWDCFKGSNLRRTEIACMSFAGQVLAGSQFAFSGTYFFEQAGMSPPNAYKLGLGGTGIALSGTILSWFLMSALGRRSVYLGGMALMALYLLIIGLLTLGHSNRSVVWAQSGLCILWLLTFSLSVAPLGWTIPAEVSSTRLRSKTICLARNTYYIVVMVANTLEPYMMNPAAWNWKGNTGFFWFGSALLTFIWGFFRLADTKGRTFDELDMMFAAQVPTREFGSFLIGPSESLTTNNHASLSPTEIAPCRKDSSHSSCRVSAA
ncbi:hypothetical protein FE257_001471 [Aspergillus nanangensis]|uniref:Major facilitator superfamily (MFS) profile domain-containing protein n=1 Tax=Aspergillus nanangensis TaxID=2582783 RepID=A0AAD4CE23_ASPNN|nr:hypothetical protein FE257_001471 [Aspergillus nanangensis]